MTNNPSNDRMQQIREHDFPTLLAFHSKHALGSLARPSCLVCGKVPEEWPPAIQHMELPDIIVCTRCRDAALCLNVEIEQLKVERDFARRELGRACQETREALSREVTALKALQEIAHWHEYANSVERAMKHARLPLPPRPSRASAPETSVHAAFDSVKADRDKAYAALGWCTGCDVPLPRCRSGGAGKKCCPDCSHPIEWTCEYVGPGGHCGKENDALRITCWYCHHPRASALKASAQCICRPLPEPTLEWCPVHGDSKENGDGQIATELLQEIATAADAGNALLLGPQAVQNLRAMIRDILAAATDRMIWPAGDNDK